MQATPLSDTVSPVAAADLVDYLGVQATDPLLPGVLVAATDAVIRHINQDLIQRAWLGVIKAPEPDSQQLSPHRLKQTAFDLPYTALISVESVMTAELVDVEYVLHASRRPAKINLLDWDYQADVEVEYTAGIAESAAEVPAAIKSAILMMAAFMYEHRGECDADGAIKRSGASNLLKPYRVEVAL